MGLWDQVGNHEISSQLEKKKRKMAKKMVSFKKKNPDVSSLGQRHAFDYQVHHQK